MLSWLCYKRVLGELLKIGLALVGVPLLALWLISPVNAATYTLTITVQNQSGQNVQGAFVVLQRCSATSTTFACPDNAASPPDTWSNVIDTQTTPANGTVSFSVETNYYYRAVATKDYYTCNTPTDCTRATWKATAQDVSKTITLNAPDLSQVTDFGCTPADIANNESTQRPRNSEEQRKVTENGVYWSSSYSYTNTIKWMKFFASDYHAWNFPLQASPDAPLPQSNMGFTGNIFKLDQRCSSDPPTGECGSGDYTDDEITLAAENNRGSWWILGEESNAKNPGPYQEKSMTGQEYALWYHRMSQLVLSQDKSAKFIFGYLAQRSPLNESEYTHPITYTRDVFAAWKTLAAQNHWCPEPPIDAIHANFFPYLRYDGSALPPVGDTNANPNHLFDYTHMWRNSLYDGKGDAWLANERLSIGTGPTYSVFDTAPTIEQANYYSQAATGRLLAPGNNKYPYMLFLMNFAGFWTPPNGVKLKSNQEEEVCRPSECLYPNPADGVTRYGRVFANFIYRNAGWEKQNFENWKQEDDAQPPAPINTFGLITSTYPTSPKTFFVTDVPQSEMNVTSFSTVEFIDDAVNSCAAMACWLRSDKHPLPPLTAQAQTFRYGIDYKITSSTAKLRLQIRFFDAAGTTQIGPSIACDSSFAGPGNWTPFQCPVGTTPANAARVQMSIRIIPQTAGTNTKVRFDNAWGRFEAP